VTALTNLSDIATGVQLGELYIYSAPLLTSIVFTGITDIPNGVELSVLLAITPHIASQ
jgi:hypothetical protein